MKGGAVRIILADRVLTVGGTLHGRIEDSTNTTGINGWTQLIDLDCLGNTLRRFSPLAIER